MKTKKFLLMILIASVVASISDGTLSAQGTKKIDGVTMLVTFHVKPEQKENFKKALLDDVQNGRTEKGNITMEFYEDKKSSTALYLFERWENQQALDKHFEMDYTKKVLELNKTALIAPMEIQYLTDLVPLTKGDLKKPLKKDNPVDLVVLFKIKDGTQDRFIKQFEKSVQNSRPEAGNIAFHIHSVQGDKTAFVLYERWRSQEALDFHFAQPYTKELFELFKEVLDRGVDDSLHFIDEIGYAARSEK